MDPDDLDDFLDGKRADLEARFQELEEDAEIDRLRRGGGAPPTRRERAAAPDRDEAPDDAADAAADAAPTDDKCDGGGDPLSEMKDALDGDEELERYLLVICPGCRSKNRMSMTRVRTADPVCGKCKQDLSFSKF